MKLFDTSLKGTQFAPVSQTQTAAAAQDTNMPNKRNRLWRPFLPGLVVGPTVAAPIDGNSATNAGALLVVFGVFAILLGVRDLRALRHKQNIAQQTRLDATAENTSPPRDRR